MLDKIEAQLTPRRRKYLYRVGWATIGLLGVLGVIDGQTAGALGILAAALLGIADGHTDPTTTTGAPGE